jgi:hypothetical protein
MDHAGLVNAADPPLDWHADIDRRVLSFIIESIGERGYAPTIREIQSACALRSLSATQSSLRRLESSGVLRTRPRRARGLELVDALPAPATGDGADVLCFFATVGRLYFPHHCRAAAMAPSAQAAEEWLGLALACLRQVEAIEAALGRAQAVHGPVSAHVTLDIAVAARRIDAFVGGTTTWIEWIALEEVDAEFILDRGVPTRTRPVQGLAATVLEGNLHTAALGKSVTAREVARLEAATGDVDDLHLRLAAGRRRATQMYVELTPVLDRVWEGAAAG